MMRRFVASLGAIALALTLATPLAAEEVVEPPGNQPIELAPGDELIVPMPHPAAACTEGQTLEACFLPAVQDERASAVIAIIGVLVPGGKPGPPSVSSWLRAERSSCMK